MSSPTPSSSSAAAAISAELVPVAAEAAPAAAAAAMMASLYVGDLAEDVGEGELYAIFSQAAPVASVRVCRDSVSGVSLGYGYVNFRSRQDATSALEALNYTLVNGRYIRIMFSNRDPSVRKSGHANVYVKNLEHDIDSKNLYDMFSPFGTVLSCKVATDSTGQSKGFGFVQFESMESAQDAINALNGMLANERKIHVGLFMRRQEREVKFTNVYTKNLPTEFTDDDLRQEFAPFGAISSTVVMRKADGASKCFGFVNFEKPEYAAEAIRKLNGKSIGNKVLYVGRAQKKVERQAELTAKFGNEQNQKVERVHQGINLYLKNLEDSVDDEKLKNLFQQFGEIASCRVMVDAQGRSKGFGFVSFTSVDAGYSAINGMNGRMVGTKPLYVGLHQRKEERKAILMARFAQRNLAMGAIPYAPQQVYFGHQHVPGHMSPHAAVLGFPPQPFVPGVAPAPPAMMHHHHNMQRPIHPAAQRAGGARYGAMPPEMFRHHHQQMIHANANYGVRYMPSAAANNGAYPAAMVLPASSSSSSQQGVFPAGLMAPPPPQAPQDGSSSLTASLTSAGPAEQQEILGNRLYPLVEELEPDEPGKVTGMLLEMDKAEIINLLESPDALRAKVREAVAVLHRSKAGDAAAAAVAVAEPNVDA